MPTVNCPVKGFEHLSVTWPDEWLMEHREKCFRGYYKAPSDASPTTKETFGTLELCQVESTDKEKPLPDFTNFEKLPLKYVQFFKWLSDTVFDSYSAEFEPDPNS